MGEAAEMILDGIIDQETGEVTEEALDQIENDDEDIEE